MYKKDRKFNIKPRPVPRNCEFCKSKTEPVYDDTVRLSRYLTERAKIIPQSRTGICNKHQKAVTGEIKYARHLSLLPFVVKA